ncbi:delta endotoxin C-terminal domain-containing protein [Bacillus cereus]|uniref:delta endotoxin C-terminal domain-containing protein n=1 Tax=Bacillus cereus TaxID=1396 RepID=UPI000BED73B9|nr:delta endotoxin C-terminal domain-containing protein [Bacillus cereus]PEA06279.1 hypothetical protein CON37_02355 [Bacillus cereus]
MPAQPINVIENSIVAPPRLFAWLREMEMVGVDRFATSGIQYYKQTFQNTLRDKQWSISKGRIPENGITNTLTIPSPQSQDDIWKITAYLRSTRPDAFDDYPILGFTYHFTQSPDQFFGYKYKEPLLLGLPCRGKDSGICEICDFENNCSNEPPNTTMPCEDKQLYSHRLSYVGAGENAFGSAPLSYYGHGWTHISADATNLIDAEKITQIPAVKGSLTSPETRVVKGPGSTGGDLVELPNSSGVLQVKVTTPASETVFGYAIRLRYTSNADTSFGVSIVQPNSAQIDRGFTLPATTSSDTLAYQDFGYYNFPRLELEVLPATEETSIINLFNNGGGNVILDKIEFIPIEWTLEEYQANQDLEEAKTAVNTLFTSDVKNVLKLNITDSAVDQVANLVECISEDFHAQEKMILLDQVKFAKRLSQARNLLNYGDFESSDWSGENGWRTSNHVHVASDNPIFKGHYLHMPGANQPQMSNAIYPTYIYQKVDESKLKSYTRYHVRGFVGNSKDLELLVERYGKEVYVEMDVLNDIRYSLPMNAVALNDAVMDPITHVHVRIRLWIPIVSVRT